MVAGFLFAFAVVVMPGIGRLDNHQFLKAFQVMDGIIQRNQPLFMLVWLGSIFAIIAAAISGTWHLDGMGKVLLYLTTALYLFGVQGITLGANIPRNNRLQSLDLNALDTKAVREEREHFEFIWNRANGLRTILAVVVAGLLYYLILRL